MTKLFEGTIDHGSALAFDRYRNMIESKGYNPVNHTIIEDGDPTCLEHLLWMCIEARKNISALGDGFSVDKYSRWLGFVQGCLIMQKYTTVENERNITRPLFTKNKE